MLLNKVFSFQLSTLGAELTLGGTHPNRYEAVRDCRCSLLKRPDESQARLTWISNGSPVIWYTTASSARLGGAESASGLIAGAPAMVLANRAGS
jgi:hypothetical protein